MEEEELHNSNKGNSEGSNELVSEDNNDNG